MYFSIENRLKKVVKAKGGHTKYWCTGADAYVEQICCRDICKFVGNMLRINIHLYANINISLHNIYHILFGWYILSELDNILDELILKIAGVFAKCGCCTDKWNCWVGIERYL